MTNLEKLQQLQLWLEDNVDQGHTALVYDNGEGKTLTQTDCSQALGSVLGINDGIDLYAETMLKLAREMVALPLNVPENKAKALSNMAQAIAKLTEKMYQLDNEISDQLGQSVTSVTDMFDELSKCLLIPVKTQVKLKASVKTGHRCPEGRENNSTAEVKALFYGGRVQLSRDLHGCCWWHVNDLEPA